MVRMLLLPAIQKMLSDRDFTLESSLTGWTNIHISSYMAASGGTDPPPMVSKTIVLPLYYEAI